MKKLSEKYDRWKRNKKGISVSFDQLNKRADECLKEIASETKAKFFEFLEKESIEASKKGEKHVEINLKEFIYPESEKPIPYKVQKRIEALTEAILQIKQKEPRFYISLISAPKKPTILSLDWSTDSSDSSLHKDSLRKELREATLGKARTEEVFKTSA